MSPLKDPRQIGLKTGDEECQSCSSTSTNTSKEIKLRREVKTFLRNLVDSDYFHQLAIVREHYDPLYPSAISTIHKIFGTSAQPENVQFSGYLINPTTDAEYWLIALRLTKTASLLENATV